MLKIFLINNNNNNNNNKKIIKNLFNNINFDNYL